ncbi:MAG TPA: ascorbate-dependent monooxygenase [Thermoanaerobaculia bacterium]|nr:ascorbate-dependent monooxygenase [Thermoanaerobaculia bacterium]
MKKTALAAVLLLALVAAARRRAVLPPSAPPVTGPTFSKEVVRIFADRCQSCHHPGDIAPFSLMTYGDAAAHALEIKLMTRTRQMPPWKPVGGCGEFLEPRVLTQDEIDTISKWVENGAPEGNRADLPAPRVFDSNWTLGQPDGVFANAEAFTPGPDGDIYRCFTIPTNLAADKYVSAVDIHPGDRGTVHHVIAFIDSTGESQKLDDDDPGPGYTCFGGPGFNPSDASAATLGGWAPGARPLEMPDGVAFKLPANSRVVLQVHYHPHNGAPKPDKTEIAVYYAKTPPTKLMRIVPMINDTFTIPPGDANYRVTAGLAPAPFEKTPLPVPVHLWMVAPHMHLLGRKMNVTATLPNGSSQCLININDWDFNWQGQYRYKNSIALPSGTRLSAEAFYDNSPNNARNPNDPPKPVSWGEQTTDEMCIAFLGVTLDGENLALGKTADASWIRSRF